MALLMHCSYTPVCAFAAKKKAKHIHKGRSPSPAIRSAAPAISSNGSTLLNDMNKMYNKWSEDLREKEIESENQMQDLQNAVKETNSQLGLLRDELNGLKQAQSDSTDKLIAAFARSQQDTAKSIVAAILSQADRSSSSSSISHEMSPVSPATLPHSSPSFHHTPSVSPYAPKTL